MNKEKSKNNLFFNQINKNYKKKQLLINIKFIFNK
jgi:hypothetical protein